MQLFMIGWKVQNRKAVQSVLAHRYWLVQTYIPYSKYFLWWCNFVLFAVEWDPWKTTHAPEQVSKVIISITFNFCLNKQANLICASNLIYNPQQFLHSLYCIFQWLSVLPNWIPSSAVIDWKAKHWPSTKAFSSYCSSSYCSLSLSVCPTQQ